MIAARSRSPQPGSIMLSALFLAAVAVSAQTSRPAATPAAPAAAEAPGTGAAPGTAEAAAPGASRELLAQGHAGICSTSAARLGGRAG
jgi:hypothetical protein